MSIILTKTVYKADNFFTLRIKRVLRMKKYCLKSFNWILPSIIILSLCTCAMPIDDIAAMSSKEMIEHTTRGVKNACITVGVVQNGQMSFKVYGENGKILPNSGHVYVIASVSKSFTGALFCKAVSEGKVNLDDSIDRFLDLPAKNYYPTIKRLLTHTSGYEREYYMGPFSTNFFNGGNAYYGITEKMVLNLAGEINLENRDYPHVYSNFGYAVAGLVLEGIYHEDYTPLMNNYVKNELGLNNTKISDGSGDLSHYLVWNSGNPFVASGGMISTVTDSMKFAQMQMDETPPYSSLSHNAMVQHDPVSVPELDLYLDAYGLGWEIDTVNNKIMHGGVIGNYNCCIIFDKSRGIAVVVLSNMAGQYKVNAQAIGAAKLKELQN
jgi:CubicO group peptidase (beta-lactamase class C family)